MGRNLFAKRFLPTPLPDELELLEKQLAQVEQAMEAMLHKTGYAEQILSIKGIGIVTAASFLGEAGDPLRFENARQIANYAGYNLVEDSSGKSKIDRSSSSFTRWQRTSRTSLLFRFSSELTIRKHFSKNPAHPHNNA